MQIQHLQLGSHSIS